MLKDLAGANVVQASSPAQVRHPIDRSARIALGANTVVAPRRDTLPQVQSD